MILCRVAVAAVAGTRRNVDPEVDAAGQEARASVPSMGCFL